jgi:hypothetical protein
MFQELVHEDIVFGVFPRIAVSMDRSICSWPKNSVDDILDMIKQALEVRTLQDFSSSRVNVDGVIQGIAFIHEKRIAHRVLPIRLSKNYKF